MSSRFAIPILIPLTLTLLCCGCGEESPTSPDTYETLISMNTVVVSGAKGITLLGVTDSTYVFYVSSSAPDISKGDIIVGIENGGYIRKVTSATRAPYRLFVETEPASLADAVISGRADTTIRFGMGSAYAGVEDETGADGLEGVRLENAVPGVTMTLSGLNLSGITLQSGEVNGHYVCVEIASGRIDFDPDLDIGIAISNRTVREFSAVAYGDLELDFEMAVRVDGDVECSREVPIASVSKSAVHYIGPVPIVEVIEFSFYAGFSLSSNFIGSFTSSCSSTFTTKMGASYGGGVWNGTDETSQQVNSYSHNFDKYAEAEIIVYVKPVIDVAFYSVEGFRIEFEPNQEITAVTREWPDWNYELYSGIKGRTENNLSVLGYGLSPYTGQPLDIRTRIDAGPYATDEYIYLREWGSEGSGDYQFGYPKGIALGPEGHVYVIDNWNHRVQKFDSDGIFVSKWGIQGSADGQFEFPEKAATDFNGNVYVVDNDNYRIQKFTSSGTFLTKWGSQGSGDGNFIEPMGIAVDDSGYVYIADHDNNRIQKFDSAGSYVKGWGNYGSGSGQLNGPSGISVGMDGNIYVTERYNNRIQIFSSTGDFIGSWGGYGSADGQFDYPIDVASDADGNVYVVDYGNDRIQKFSCTGDFITKLGDSGTGDGEFDRPEGIAVDPNGNIYVADSRNKRIQEFAPKAR